MGSEIERQWKPRIYRAWNQRTGQFYWSVTAPKANSWTGATLHSARQLESKARTFAMHLNAMARQQRAVDALTAWEPHIRPRCPLCNYQHGHQIGCDLNPLDIALRRVS